MSYWKRFALIFLCVIVIIDFSQGCIMGYTHDYSLMNHNNPINWLSVQAVLALGIAYLTRYIWR